MCHKRSPSKTQKGGKGAVEYDCDHDCCDYDCQCVRLRGAGVGIGA